MGDALRLVFRMSDRLTAELRDLARPLIYRYSEKPFLLASGASSHHYFNCKSVTLHPQRLRLLASVICEETLPGAGIDVPSAVGGLTLGADPICYAVSLHFWEKGKLVYPLIVRKEAKGHGTGRQIEGEVDAVREVVVMDDVITTAGSTLKAVDALRSAGLSVKHAVCIVDREEGGRENLRSQGIDLFSIFRKSEFVKPGGA